MKNFSRSFEINGAKVAIETEKVIKVVSDNDSFYLFDGFKIPQPGTLGYNFHAYAWDNETGEFSKCDMPAKWDSIPFKQAKVSDLCFEDVDYYSFRPYFAKIAFGKDVTVFYTVEDFLAKWLPGFGTAGYKASVDAGRATVKFSDETVAWKYL